MPNPTLGGFQNNQSNLLGVLPVRQNPWGFTIDHAISEKQNIHLQHGATSRLHRWQRSPSSNPLNSFTYFPDLGTVFIANYSYAISPHLVMTVGASWLGELQLPDPAPHGDCRSASAPGAPLISGITFGGNNSPSNFGTSNTNSINRKLGVAFENNYLWI